jgi:hypothetical protein
MDTQGGATDSQLHRRYVGPVERWDRSRQHQMEVLLSEGLLVNHTVVDLGCGPLCAGSLLIPWLNERCYYGIEPNREVLTEGIEREGLGNILTAKQAVLVVGECLDTPGLVETGHVLEAPDFVLMHSIFSHMRHELLVGSLRAIHNAFATGTPVIASFAVTRDRRYADHQDQPQWEYPGLIHYTARRLESLIDRCGWDLTWRNYREPGGQRWARLVNR